MASKINENKKDGDSYVSVSTYVKKAPFARKRKLSLWSVYNHIRKNRFDKKDVRIEKVLLERIKVRLGAAPHLKR